MKNLTLLAIALATVAVAVPPAAAHTADRSAESEAIIAAPLVAPAPAEQAPPADKCNGQEEEISESFVFTIFQEPAECEPTCVEFCEDNDGYLISSLFRYRDLTCVCRCCVPRQ